MFSRSRKWRNVTWPLLQLCYSAQRAALDDAVRRTAGLLCHRGSIADREILRALLQEQRGFGERHRRTEIISLHFIAATAAQKIELRGRFDTFRNHGEMKCT